MNRDLGHAVRDQENKNPSSRSTQHAALRTFIELPVISYRACQSQTIRDLVVVEEPLEIRLAGEPFQVLMRLPGGEKELALGFLFTEGIVQQLSEVLTLHFCGRGADPTLTPDVVEVTLTPEALARRGRRQLEVSYASCGLCAKEAVTEICRQVKPVAGALTLSSGQLLALMARLPEAQPVFAQTGGAHAAVLATPEGAVFLSAEDVGRHNALDKVIGRALLERRDLGEMVALLSGRLSFEMALKAARAGIPVLAGVSAPTSLAVQLAQELHLTLVGFVREDRYNVYTHPRRLQ